MSTIRVRRCVLASSMALALFAPHAFAQTSTTSSSDQQATQQSTSPSAQPADQKSQAKQLQAVTVTGSMIPRVEIEGPAPVVTITGEQIKQQGSPRCTNSWIRCRKWARRRTQPVGVPPR
jgi:outer membrane receptor protein involved in Fe transport